MFRFLKIFLYSTSWYFYIGLNFILLDFFFWPSSARLLIFPNQIVCSSGWVVFLPVPQQCHVCSVIKSVFWSFYILGITSFNSTCSSFFFWGGPLIPHCAHAIICPLKHSESLSITSSGYEVADLYWFLSSLELVGFPVSLHLGQVWIGLQTLWRVCCGVFS